MRRVVFLTLLALALPIAAWANGIDLTNQYGSISISNAGITSVQSQLKSFNGITALAGHSLGSVSFSTGALTSGCADRRSTYLEAIQGHVACIDRRCRRACCSAHRRSRCAAAAKCRGTRTCDCRNRYAIVGRVVRANLERLCIECTIKQLHAVGSNARPVSD